jgi:citrate lyase subunit beta/citryl-CoA lyase
LPAAIGAISAREADGRYTPVYDVVRTLALMGAHAAGVLAIDTIYPAFRDQEGLARYAARARRDGFTGMLAIHPAQIAPINAAFTPSEAEIAHARAVIAAFATGGGAGAIALDGKMLDAPHLRAAERILAQNRSGR